MPPIAAVDVLGHLPGPVSKTNAGAGDLLAGEVFAYAVSSSIAVVDVHRMQLACVLHGGHRTAAVTAVAWCPECFTGDVNAHSHLRLASGDNEGRVVVWDVTTATAMATLEDPSAAAAAAGPSPKKVEPGKGGPVRDLVWVMSNPCLLAVVLANGMLLVWDQAANQVVWKKELGAEQALASIKVDPTDWRHICLCGAKGSIVVLRLTNMAQNKVDQQTYKVDMSGSKPGDTLRCCFSTTRDLLYVLLPREVVVFDLEFGQPAASTVLPTSKAPFRDILGCFGHQRIGKSVTEGGIDLLYCSHQDGSLSVWRRQVSGLSYNLLCLHKLVPPASRISNNATVSLLCIAACAWVRCNTDPRRSTVLPPMQHTVSEFGVVTANSPRAALDNVSHPFGRAPRTEVPEGPPQSRLQTPAAAGADEGGDPFADLAAARLGPAAAAPAQAQHIQDPQKLQPQHIEGVSKTAAALGRDSLLVMAVSDEGHVWQWDVALHGIIDAPAGGDSPQKSLQAAPTAAQDVHLATRPALQGLLHTLPHSVTTFSVCPIPVGAAWQAAGQQPSSISGAGGDAVAVLAAVTSAGNVELITLQRGALMPLNSSISVSLGAHKDVVRGVRWLGPSPRVVSFSSEKVQHGFRNTLLLTDIRNRSSVPFREVGAENAPMLGIRASPLGRYILVLLRGAPSEIWAVGGSTRPVRVRVLDLPFTAVEWVLPSEMTHASAEALSPAKWMVWERSPLAKERSLQGYFDDQDDNLTPLAQDVSQLPEEKLAFALGDGRVGLLAVKGRKVSDTKPKRPQWGLLSSGEVHTTTIAAWAHLVILGDADGNLNRWDTTTGRITTVNTGQGAVRRLHFAPPACDQLDFSAHTLSASAMAARVSCLFVNGTFGVYELDARNELKQGPVTVAASQKVGRVVDMSWAPLPQPVGAGSVLALALDDGSLAFVDASQTLEQSTRRQRLQAFKHLIGGTWPYPQGVLSPPPPLGSALLLPLPWAQLLRLLLQQGLPAELLQQLWGPSSDDDEVVEAAVWNCLPGECCRAWQQAPHRMGTEEAQELSYLAEGTTDARLRRNTADAIPSVGTEDDPFSDSADAGNGWEGSSPGQSESSPGADQGKDGQTGGRFNIRSISGRLGRLASTGKGEIMKNLGLSEEDDTIPARQPDLPSISVTPRHTYNAPLIMVLRALAHMRAGGALLHAAEWRMYAAALAAGSVAARMAVAATVAGNAEEARFWQGLPATLRAVKEAAAASGQAAAAPQKQDLEAAVSEAFPAASRQQPAPQPPVPMESAGKLWNKDAELAEARERTEWHEVMSRRQTDVSEKLQDRRVIEYVVLGDYPTAVGFLLASKPERTARYYRDALCTLALAAVSTEGPAPSDGPPSDAVSRTLHVQAAKVVAAHAASMGDSLLGVPLMCSAGLASEAVALLQEGHLWRYASTLAAHRLRGEQQAAALERWAAHIHQAEGSLWRALGVMSSAGALRSAVLLLRKAGLPGAAVAFAQTCAVEGLSNPAAPADAGFVENLFHHTGNTPRRMSFSHRPGAAAEAQETSSVEIDYLQHMSSVFQAL